jgi:hypothetical protein
MKRGGSIPRTRLKPRSRTKGGRGSLPRKVAWLHGFPCDICYWSPVEVHHDRHLGSRATDRRTVPLCRRCHREGEDSVQALGRTRFQQVHRYDMDVRCAYWQERWDAQERAA